MRYKSRTGVLALDLHPRRFGYVVLESPDRLLDWGVCSYRRKGKPTDVLVQKRLRPLLEQWNPTLLAIRGARQLPPRQQLLQKQLLKGIATEAESKRVRVRMLRSTKERAGSLTKYGRAQEAAKRFPVLIGRLP